MASNTRVVTSAEVSLHGDNIPLYEENGLLGITDGVSVAFSVEINRLKEVVSVTAKYGAETVRVTPKQFATI